MQTRYTQSFKIQAVEKVLRRSENTGVAEIAESLGVGYSTLQKWVANSRHAEFESNGCDEELDSMGMKQEKRPQDWSLEEKLNMVIACGSLDEEGISLLCREKGLYLHHIKQWKQDFIDGAKTKTNATMRSESKKIKQENIALKKELNRKEKALAETAALLVLQKKVNEIWGNDEDNSQ